MHVLKCRVYSFWNDYLRAYYAHTMAMQPSPFSPVTEYGLGILSVPVYPGHVHRTYLRLFLLLFPLYLRPPLSGARIVQYSIARKKSMHRPPVPARLLSVLPMVSFLSAA